MNKWERVTSQGRTIYWRRRLSPRHRYLAVSRDGRGGWQWALRGPERAPGGVFRVHAGSGPYGSAQAAKRGAEEGLLSLVLESDATRGFDLAELARRLETTEQSAARAARSLVQRGAAVRFVGGVGPQRVHYQAAES